MSFNFKRGPAITEYEITTPKLESGEKTCLAVISDLHECTFGLDNRGLFRAVSKIKPDALVISGDLIDGSSLADPSKTMRTLKKLHDRYSGIYFAPGNHERRILDRTIYTRQMVGFIKGLKEAGIRLMSNEKKRLGERIRIYGLDLNHDYYRRVIKKNVPKGMLDLLLGKPDKRCFNILIAHDPDHFPEYALWGPDLVLSGHVHGGIIRLSKIGGLVSPGYRLFPEYSSGIYERGDSKMIVSRGTGSHTINIRINNPPEILKVVIKGE